MTGAKLLHFLQKTWVSKLALPDLTSAFVPHVAGMHILNYSIKQIQSALTFAPGPMLASISTSQSVLLLSPCHRGGALERLLTRKVRVCERLCALRTQQLYPRVRAPAAPRALSSPPFHATSRYIGVGP